MSFRNEFLKGPFVCFQLSHFISSLVSQIQKVQTENWLLVSDNLIYFEVKINELLFFTNLLSFYLHAARSLDFFKKAILKAVN